eukprot:7433724-Pyramimonas_sp.AAC.1
MRKPRREGIQRAIGEVPDDWVVRIDAGKWVVSPRDGLWGGSCPRSDFDLHFLRLPSPWDNEWAFHFEGSVQTWTRSRGDPNE